MFSNQNRVKSFFRLLGVFLIFFMIPSAEVFSQNKVIFNHLNVENGLSQNSVISIVQDKSGYMWFGTKYGLNRYDGRNFKIFKNTGEQNSIRSDDFVRGLSLDARHQLWVGSLSGVDIFMPRDLSFKHIITNINTTTCLLNDSHNVFWAGSNEGLMFSTDKNHQHFEQFDLHTKKRCQVICIYEDILHQVWAGTSAGLIRITNNHGKFTIISFNHTADPLSISSNFITSITEDHRNRLWVGTKYDGLNIYDPIKNTFRQLYHLSGQQNTLVNNSVRRILCDRAGNLWIGTQDGLSFFDFKASQFVNYQHDDADPHSLSQNSIYDIYQDNMGSIWVGTYFGGVDVIYAINTPFKIYQSDKYKNSINRNVISAIVEDQKNNLWIGTEAGGLNYFDRNRQKFTSYEYPSKKAASLSSNLIKSICIDDQQTVWVGTSMEGLSSFNMRKQKFKSYRHDENNKSSISADNVNCVFQNSVGIFFVGTYFGLDEFNPSTDKFSRVNIPYYNTSDEIIKTIYEDRSGNLWIGSQFSIKFLSKGKDIFESFTAGPRSGLTNSYVNSFLEDSNGNLWVGTYHGGLNLFNRSSKKFRVFTEKDGLPSSNVLGILEDKKGFLWISTDNGLSKFDIKTYKFLNYDKNDGLPSNVFNNNSYLKDHNGELYFGGYNGMVSFYPQDIIKNPNPPKVVFSDLKLFKRSVIIGDSDGVLTEAINLTKKITFSSDQNIFTLDFAALNFIKPEKNKYAYKLENFERNWNYVDLPSATYTNLPAGKYRFLVRASNNDGVWSVNPAEIEIVVLPPLWKTNWAYLLYLIALCVIAYVIIRFLETKSRLKRDLFLEHREVEQQERIFKMKLNFFTNVSHEIRTPLTLIMGPLERVLNNTRDKADVQQNLLTVKANTDRLYRLVTELLDFRKAESGNFKLYLFQENIVKFIKEIFLSFRSMAESRDIEYSFFTDNDEVSIYFDKDQLEKVFFNLLSNAFKFTPDGGQIAISVNCTDPGAVIINVTDNGRGIPDNSLKEVFENFYQVGQTGGYSIGTGIGLALTKSIVELHGGAVDVESREATDSGQGYTRFTVLLKTGIDHLNAEDLLLNKATDHTFDEYNIQNYIADAVHPEGVQLAPVEKNNTILLVEDNDDVREFIRQSLTGIYNVVVCANGQEGCDKAFKIIPDLVISDVMMPLMDGLELCRKLKTDARTSHIPVILLTARSAHIHQINGLQNGADAYVTKPFSNQLLQLTIQNLLALTVALQKKYSSQLLSTLPVINASSNNDEKLLQRLYDVIDKNMSNAEFGLTELTMEIGMSKSVLYRKFSALTNLSLTDFIKTHRLKRAASLLQKGEFSVSEIAYMVGFSDPKYFSKEFSKVYGQSPSKYLTTNALH